MAEKFSNALINESSPYLLQHAHNPVQWYPWGETALARAKKLDLPILVSIGYAACHWCHVMERESFEDEETAEFMNRHFVNIKIDREERPDLDHIYMDAVQTITGSGGWPLNVFLTPEGKPFYGGTYFPPKPAFNRPSWKDALASINDAWNTHRSELEQQASSLAEHIGKSGNLFNLEKGDGDQSLFFSKQHCVFMAENLLKTADREDGGFGNAPKFPQTFSIGYLLAYAHFFQDEKALAHANLSLQKMLDGGIYDQLAGGLARYSTDSRWLAPHFEKMLYDNALLVSVLADAFRATGIQSYVVAIQKTLRFFLDEKQHPDGGFYAALDADSEGEEGKFYVWDKKEIDDILGKDAEIFCKWYGVSEKGNWEGRNILHISKSGEVFAVQNGIEEDDLIKLISECNKKLLTHRNQRIRPSTDDKILLGWNALMLTAFCKAYAALGDEAYRKKAVALYEFIKKSFSKDGEIRFHTYKNGNAKYPAFIDDYAYLVQACIHLQEITSDQQYLTDAYRMTEFVIRNFENAETGLFFYTHMEQADIIARKVDVYDSATPSGNSVMAENLFYLSVVFEKPEWNEKAVQMLRNISEIMVKYPGSFAVWGLSYLKQAIGMNEVVITGRELDALREKLLALYIPNMIFQGSEEEKEFPLLRFKSFSEKSLIYLCKNYQCREPVTSVEKLEMLLKKHD